MKSLLGIILWMVTWTTIRCQFGGHGIGLPREIFILNLEDGFFGCQVNESTDILQIFELSKLCDGQPQCFRGSDELRDELKCTGSCDPPCQNGVCLDDQCHCNDGFGGCECETPDENECKYRPCDVFAHCTNTLGSFYCSCLPGYEGNGFECKDINECEIPELSAKCVRNAACCNVPASYICNCSSGFEGNGFEECRDIDECQRADTCGERAYCTNSEGSFTCSCIPGYTGDAFTGCHDRDECAEKICGAGAICKNLEGSFQCSCPTGYVGDPYTSGCTDVNECDHVDPSVCGARATCRNLLGSYECLCPPGFTGNPRVACEDIAECERPDMCGDNAGCHNTEGSYICRCFDGFNGDPYKKCENVNECSQPNICGKEAICEDTAGSYVCLCRSGYSGNPRVSCQNVDECQTNPCGSNSQCRDSPGNFSCSCREGFTGNPFSGCLDINECAERDRCGVGAICINTLGSYQCKCLDGYDGLPDVACERVSVNVSCNADSECTDYAQCAESACSCRRGFEPQGAVCADRDECSGPNPCGEAAICRNTLGGYTCECIFGYQGSPPEVPCRDVNECMLHPFPCGNNAKCMNLDGSYECSCPSLLIGDPKTACQHVCDGVSCGPHSTCKPDGQSALCICDEGFSFVPHNVSAMCKDIDECDTGMFGAYGMCGHNAVCVNALGSFTCTCPPGYRGHPRRGCVDIDECKEVGCGAGALCSNAPGSFSCACPPDTEGDPRVKCLAHLKCNVQNNNTCPGNAFCDHSMMCVCPEPNIGEDCRHPCDSVACGLNAQCILINGMPKCMCEEGFAGLPNEVSGCEDIDECSRAPQCGKGAVCRNTFGSYWCECAEGFEGDPRVACTPKEEEPDCRKTPCADSEQCVEADGIHVCICRPGFVRDAVQGHCRDVNECLEVKDKAVCGLNANCRNIPSSYECSCPAGFSGNPYVSCWELEKSCSLDVDCPNNLMCLKGIKEGNICGCTPHMIQQGDFCIAIGFNCSTHNPCPSGQDCMSLSGGAGFCVCPKGYVQDKAGLCRDINECTEMASPGCKENTECVNLPGSYQCLCLAGFTGHPEVGCKPITLECKSKNQCPMNQVCVRPGECKCLPPYVQDGSNCRSPCDFVPCGFRSKCTITPTGGRCECDMGYSGDPVNGCEDLDECSQNPCAASLECVNTIGSYICTGGLSECMTDDECPSDKKCEGKSCVDACNKDCGLNSFCVAHNHVAQCECLAGFKKTSDDKCVSMCENYVCGSNAQCVITKEGNVTCRCPDGFTGLPHAGGRCIKESCGEDKDCDGEQGCIQGRCKARCEGIVCGVGARCDRTRNRCVCWPFFIGNPNLLCVPIIGPPFCIPTCGEGAQCEYGFPNKCVCRPGLSGNPYEKCSPAPKSCSQIQCGSNAYCVPGLNRVDCVCPPGFVGSPYLGCNDYDECSRGNVCGEYAHCRNTIGSFTCECDKGYYGNPYVRCTAESIPSRPQIGECPGRPGCKCNNHLECASPNLICEAYKCIVDPCQSHACGPNAFCVVEKGHPVCKCLPTFPMGDPTDLMHGCKGDQCINDLSVCKDNEICITGPQGFRLCTDVCKVTQCGPNAYCQGSNHRAECVCRAEYPHGNPYDLTLGCIAIYEVTCTTDEECPHGQICRPGPTGRPICKNACDEIRCGAGAVCSVENRRPVCRCREDYVPFQNDPSRGCIPDNSPCQQDNDCPSKEDNCKVTRLGTKTCAHACLEFRCKPKNAECVVVRRRGQCQCTAGFTGDPNSRDGCQPIRQDICQSDGHCPEDKVCIQQQGIFQCVDVCQLRKCGPNAVCVASHHAATCTCPPGLYIGDANDLQRGCVSVGCVANKDCKGNLACIQYECKDPCKNACGKNTVCISQNRQAVCRCKPGFNGDPRIQCEEMNFCSQSVCHRSAVCKQTPGSYVCTCPPEYIGDPYTYGCHLPGECRTGDSDCKDTERCIQVDRGVPQCGDPCDGFCGPNTLCSAKNHQPVCTCRIGFIPNASPLDGCVREYVHCSSDAQCGSGQVCLNAHCRPVCSEERECAPGERCINNRCSVACVTHASCQKGTACLSGVCIPGCRSELDCSGTQTCSDAKCIEICDNPLICPSNTVCRVIAPHKYSCESCQQFPPPPGCPSQTPPATCSSNSRCPPGYECKDGKCKQNCRGGPSSCPKGETCVRGLCAGVCSNDRNCEPGEICHNQRCQEGCHNQGDCRSNEECTNGRCSCRAGFVKTSSGCADADECQQNPCHVTAVCINTPGSYRCQCSNGENGDPYKAGCQTNRCLSDAQCSPVAQCLKEDSGHTVCIDPCLRTTCGKNAVCVSRDHRPFCECPPNFAGNPQESDVGCYPVQCRVSGDCKATEECYNFRCENPCEAGDSCAPYGICEVSNHQATCKCNQGFIFNAKGFCEDVDECKSAPCGQQATCVNAPGSFYCRCPANYHEDIVNDQVHCVPNGECPKGDADCPTTAECLDVNGVSKCVGVCDRDKVCGKKAECRAVDRRAVCFCPVQHTGDPRSECFPIECLSNAQCQKSQACVDHKCTNPCNTPSACGANTHCTPSEHQALCQCKEGFHGDPRAFCRQVIPCVDDSMCPVGETCQNRLCRIGCDSDRSCAATEKCILNRCTQICGNSKNCAEGEFCDTDGICKPPTESRCSEDTDCETNQFCNKEDKSGQNQCLDPCERVICEGRNTECRFLNRNAICSCKEGHFGNPDDPLVGCQKVECTDNRKCGADKACIDHKCQNPCSKLRCGPNAACQVHLQAGVCRCLKNHEGDPLLGCQPVDFCHSKPCQAPAACVGHLGDYSCHCPQGMTVKNDVCVPTSECPSGDKDCPPTTQCVLNALGVGKCADPCTATPCGPNTRCRTVDHRAVCECESGFAGNPGDKKRGCLREKRRCSSLVECLPGQICENGYCGVQCSQDRQCSSVEKCVNTRCKDVCQSDEHCLGQDICVSGYCEAGGCRKDADCKDDETCMDSKCRAVCDHSSACGLNALCRVSQHQKQCSCQPGFQGDANVFCRRIPQPCTSITNCQQGQICTDNRCQLQCASDNDCALSEKCLSGYCYAQCRNDAECLGEICERGVCQGGCRSNSQCPSMTACIENQCRDLCQTGTACGPNAQCRMISHRVVCTCPDSFVPNPTPNVGCIRVHPVCAIRPSCPVGTGCTEGRCFPICSTDRDCAVNEKCSNGRCHVTCSRYCPEGEICSGGVCIVGCRENGDCKSDQACIRNKCIDPCNGAAACGTNSICKTQDHHQMCSCPPGLTGNPLVACVRLISTCGGNGDCATGQACLRGTCTVRCSENKQCLDNEECIKEQCIPVCSSNANCPDTHICRNGLCQYACDDPRVCGVNAMCKSMMRTAICSCPAGTTGDPRKYCYRVPSRCDANILCENTQPCEGGYCPETCDAKMPCSLNEVCVGDRCRVSCKDGYNCPGGHVCGRRGYCMPGCSSSSDCADDKACVQSLCQDPCAVPSFPCGQNSQCKVLRHHPMCMCPLGFEGEPTKGCLKVTCNKDSECSLDKACINGVCKSPCSEGCGLHAQCRVQNRQRVCTCPLGYNGNPETECYQVLVCDPQSSCPENLQCQKNRVCGCQPPFARIGDFCILSRTECATNNPCATNQECRVVGSTRYCICPKGFRLLPDGSCDAEDIQRQNPCSDIHCAPGQTCHNGVCIHLCKSNSDCSPPHSCVQGACQISCDGACGQNAECRIIDKRPVCSCVPGYQGNPRIGCTPIVTVATPGPVEPPTSRPECTTDVECSSALTCRQFRCISPCDDCGVNARCQAVGHRAVCSCPTGYEGNPTVQCNRVTVTSTLPPITYPTLPPECLKDTDCRRDQICRKQQCQNPCDQCGTNAECKVVLHRAVCSCIRGYEGNPLVQCYKVTVTPAYPLTPSPPPPECVRDSDCRDDQACRSQKCQSPCDQCGVNADCRVMAHRVVCSCPKGYRGNPTVQCIVDTKTSTRAPATIPTPRPECLTDGECRQDQVCRGNRCQNPCDECGVNAECKVVMHRAVCTCLIGYQGNPRVQCIRVPPTPPSVPPTPRPECRKDVECPDDKACFDLKCQNPCIVRQPCGINADCQAKSHRPVCRCLVGYEGNPLLHCLKVIPPVTSPTEAPTPPPECLKDDDCPNDKACFDRKCQNPCKLRQPCGVNADCRAVDHSHSCTCIRGYVGNPWVQCTKIPPSTPPPVASTPRPECRKDVDCSDDKACFDTKCQNPCLIRQPCGVNSECKTVDHVPVCSCMKGYRGNPLVQCVRIPPPTPASPQPPTTRPECVRDDECPFDKACFDHRCQNPCQVRQPCGVNADCKVLDHSPFCTCINGYVGNPWVQCVKVPPPTPAPPPPTPRPECRKDDDCSNDKACFDHRCQNPCVVRQPCGINAECEASDHVPVCTCLPGYQGNPLLQCTKVPPPSQPTTAIPTPRPECLRDDDCPTDKACYDKKCQNPCQLRQPCGVNAECRAVDHSHTCHCYSGYFGNPWVQCTKAPPSTLPPEPSTPRPECRKDDECPDHHACFDHRCRDPCLIRQPCGVNTECKTANHIPVCSCLRGYAGNPLVQCVKIPPSTQKPSLPSTPRPECMKDDECANDMACFDRKCQNPCLVRQSCGVNAECKPVDHSPFCSCFNGYVGNPWVQCSKVPPPTPPSSPSTPRPECRKDDDCPHDKACFDYRCQNPCVVRQPCGINAECRAKDHVPLCTCIRGYEGNPLLQCFKVPPPTTSPITISTPRPECLRDDDCPEDRACFDKTCQNPCILRQPCGVNADCTAIEHSHTCNCLNGYIGNPWVQCNRVPPPKPPTPPSTPPPECRKDSECPDHEACFELKCRDPCAIRQPCGINTECKTSDHIPICSCLRGYQGNPLAQCTRIQPPSTEPSKPSTPRPECLRDDDCSDDKACFDRKCQNPCLVRQPCGVNAVCQTRDHSPNCACIANYFGNPWVQCVRVPPSTPPPPPPTPRPECRQDNDCPDNRACFDHKCQDPCVVRQPCGINAGCRASEHVPICTCLPGYVGNPLLQCDKVPPSPLLTSTAAPTTRPECLSDTDCAPDKACYNKKCENPCLLRQPCGVNAECRVVDHGHSCTCLPGYSGNPWVQCIKEILPPPPPLTLPTAPPPECRRDDDCPSNKACVDSRCQNPCLIRQPCGVNSQCKPIDHLPVCSCLPGYHGNPRIQCTKEVVTLPSTGCTRNSQCPKDRACMSGECRSPCTALPTSPCGQNAICDVFDHVPICKCPDRFIGDPQVLCQKPECSSDGDCPDDKACIDTNCRDPCLLTTFCAPTAECKAEKHRAVCRCPVGYRGDPFIACKKIECTKNDDCPSDRACVNEKCEDPCALKQQCGTHARCLVANHAVQCSCDPPWTGDPKRQCTLIKRGECDTDADCPSTLACIADKCQNPCNVLQPCHPETQCKVLDTVPWRTMICICPAGFIRSASGGCEKIKLPAPECTKDSDCSLDKACIEGQCRQFCQLTSPCAGICQMIQHRPSCVCPPKQFGDPRVKCYPVECEKDEDCGTQESCSQNHKCVDLCIIGSPCGKNAECKMVNHQSTCQCLSGYQGDPRAECFPVGCRSDSECPDDKVCITGQCWNPCLQTTCGINTKCIPANHKATCECLPSYKGNPLIICEKDQRECSHDGDCGSGLACIRERCRDPCTEFLPCKGSAECKVIDTVPWRTIVCECPSGYMADPTFGCISRRTDEGCKSHNDCPESLECKDGTCQDPCHVCGDKAFCSVFNHRAVCSCPAGHFGDPKDKCIWGECSVNEECPDDKVCHRGTCINVCLLASDCGINARCRGENHKALCYCPEGYNGNPLQACTRPACIKDEECPDDRACVNQQCQSPCLINSPCGVRALCSSSRHRAVCNCPQDFTGDPFVECTIIERSQCQTDSDCPSGLACISDKCQDPCLVLKPCGPIAQCKVIDTAPWRTMMCICPQGYVGDIHRGCKEVSISTEEFCVLDRDCPVGQACLDRTCRDPCKWDYHCGENAFCRTSIHRATCFCPEGYFGDPAVGCHKVDCTSNKDCPSDKMCSAQKKCVDPCSVKNPCGKNAECKPTNHQPQCLCLGGYQGDPLVLCTPIGCRNNNECPDDRSCFGGQCRDPCLEHSCGQFAKCAAANHQADCKCPSGYRGNPSVACVKIELSICSTDADCPSQLACIQQQCQNPCIEFQPCHSTAQCKVIDTIPWRTMICICPNGYVSDDNGGCLVVESRVEVGCTSDSNCRANETCIRGQCTNPCQQCGENAHCQIINRRATCSCPRGFYGDAKIRCIKGECSSNDDCPFDKTCHRQTCVDPCLLAGPCGINARCRGESHQAACYCPDGYRGDPLQACSQPACLKDDDCPDDRSCINEQCQSPCLINSPCGVKAVCAVSQHRAICNCPPDLTGDAFVECRLIEKGHCETDAECPSGLACIGQRCQDPCAVLKPCGPSAQCKVIDTVPWRTMVCLCPDGYMGSVERGCIPVPEVKGICIVDSECPHDLACIGGLCRDPCRWHNHCGRDAYCRAQDHRATCHCPSGFFGDPVLYCVKAECTKDSDCPQDKMCSEQQKCIDPCLFRSPCGKNTNCQASNHQPICQCMGGYQGDPLYECIPIGCRSDAECPQDKACFGGQCRDSCLDHRCGQGAKCSVSNHRAECSCPPGFRGNPAILCETIVVEVCRTDSDCPSGLACLSDQCQNPCTILHPCGPSAECKVIDTHPWRTMVCMCPNGYMADENLGCVKVVDFSCASCGNDEICLQNQCVSVCQHRNPCGSNAICSAQFHRPTCTCPPGFIGDAYSECLKVECSSDSDCPGYLACMSQKCVDVCIVSDPCGYGALCKVVNHQTMCDCPAGYLGDPMTSCDPIGCQRDDDCSDDRVCRSGQCVDLCAADRPCGHGALCKGIQHRPLCECPIGYEGNPYVFCYTGEGSAACKTDSECPSGLACIADKCQDPCAVLKPCGPGAECKVIDTSPWRTMVCICPAGFVTNDERGCERVTGTDQCSQDWHCRTDQACVQGECVIACSVGHPCKANAECLSLQHRAICSCLPGFTGNPEKSCHPAGCTKDADCPSDAACVSGICTNLCESDVCGAFAQCRMMSHLPQCRCLDGYQGDPLKACQRVSCLSDIECPSSLACLGGRCEDPCKLLGPCGYNTDCLVVQHNPQCTCRADFQGDPKQGCVKIDRVDSCQDAECPSGLSCIREQCDDYCQRFRPCGLNAYCEVKDTRPLVTIVCKCPPGFAGNASTHCTPVISAECSTDDDCPANKACVGGKCQNWCMLRQGCGLNAHCTISSHRVACTCPEGFTGDPATACVRISGCIDDSNCPGNLRCLGNGLCGCLPNYVRVDDYCVVFQQNCTTTNPCSANKRCQYIGGPVDFGICICPRGYILHPNDTCEETSSVIGRTEPPSVSVAVSCMADGVFVDVHVEGFDGVIYVKGYSKDAQCRQVISYTQQNVAVPFRVLFNTCGLFPIDGVASFILVIQKHPKLLTHKAKAYEIRCVYKVGETPITIGFNVSMITTSGTIANTGPPPTCIMKIVSETGDDIVSAELGENLKLKVEVLPKEVYGGFARGCYAMTTDEKGEENRYEVTDDNGCAIDSSVFGEWEYDHNLNALIAPFNAFKFPNGNSVRFDCNIRFCFRACQPVNCGGRQTYGRRRRQAPGDTVGFEYRVGSTTGNDTALGLPGGKPQEEITMKSNAIFIVDHRVNENLITTEPTEVESHDVCVSTTGFIIALVITALLALVAVAVAVSCWLMAYRRSPKSDGPLPHPPEFPNPLYTTPEPITEPSPDYLS